MKEFFLHPVVTIIMSVIIFGIVSPALISESSNLLVVLGVLLIGLMLWYVYKSVEHNVHLYFGKR